MSKDPAFLFYSNNFLSGTMLMTDEQVGKYIRLLIAQHQHGRLSENHMMFICKSYDPDIFKKFIKDENGMYYNERLEMETEKRQSYCESRSNKKKDIKKDRIRTSYEDHTVTVCTSYDDHSSILNNQSSILNNSINKESDFELFWEQYDKKVGKEAAKRKWIKISQADKQRIFDHIALYKIANPDKQYRKDPVTYLNQKAWNDEIIIRNGNGFENTKVGREIAARAVIDDNYGKGLNL